MGRPRKARKERNPTRQIGRWDDATWREIKEAAARRQMSVAAWAREVLLRAARESWRDE